MKFKRNPLVVEAMQFHDTDTGRVEVKKFMRWMGKPMPRVICIGGYRDLVDGEWLVRGPGHAIFPCSPGEFSLLYTAEA